MVDGHFLPDLPSVMLKEKKFCNVPYIIGFNSDEGSGFMQLQNTDFKTGLTEEKVQRLDKLSTNIRLYANAPIN